MKMSDMLVEIIDLNFVVHSNEMACRKGGRLGMDPVIYEFILNNSLPHNNYYCSINEWGFSVLELFKYPTRGENTG